MTRNRIEILLHDELLRAAGGGLALHDRSGDRRMCKASELGFSYSRLMRRFGAPFPSHSHTWLVGRTLGTANMQLDRDATRPP